MSAPVILPGCPGFGKYYEAERLVVIELEIKDLMPMYEATPNPIAKGKCRKSVQDEIIEWSDPEWLGGLRDVKQLASLLDDGWAEGATRMTGIGNDIGLDIPPAKSVRRKPTWGPSGEVNIDRALRGDWDRAFRGTRRREATGSPIINLIMAWGGSSSRSADDLFWSGAACLVLSNILEEAGYAVSISAVNNSQNPNNYDRFTVTRIAIKDAREPLRIDALAGITAHAGVWRTVGFMAKFQAPWYVPNGVGHTCGPNGTKARLIAAGDYPEGIYLPSTYSKREAVAVITSTLKSLNEGGTP